MLVNLQKTNKSGLVSVEKEVESGFVLNRHQNFHIKIHRDININLFPVSGNGFCCCSGSISSLTPPFFQCIFMNFHIHSGLTPSC